MDDFPRRAILAEMVPAELIIVEAVRAVELLGASPKLTDAVTLLDRARESVADFIDGKGPNKQASTVEVFVITSFDIHGGPYTVGREFDTYPEADKCIKEQVPPGDYQIQKIFKKS